MSGVQTVRDIYLWTPVQRCSLDLRSRSIHGRAMSPRKNSAPIEDALRSDRREFDTHPVSMNLDYPTTIDGPEKSGASAAMAIATAAEQGASIPA